MLREQKFLQLVRHFNGLQSLLSTLSQVISLIIIMISLVIMVTVTIIFIMRYAMKKMCQMK